MNPHHQDDRVTIHHGDALEVLRQLPDASVDAVVTDPPYGLEFMGKTWDRLGDIGQASHGGFSKAADNFKGMALPASYNASANVKCQRCGKWKFDHVGRKCECGPNAVWPNVKAQQARAMQDWHANWTAECLRVLKPGGHLLAFGGSRTWHRLACAVEDAGFEIRDSIAWLYGCHDDQTEVLTRRGWINGLDLTADDEVAQWSTDGTVELVRPTARQRYDYDGDLIAFRNADVDQLVTPNHRVYRQVSERRQIAGKRAAAWSDWQVDQAADINRWQPMRLPAAGIHDGPGIGGTDYAALLGWVWAEGGFDPSGTGVRVYQSSTNAPLVDEIAALLDRLGAHKRYDYVREWKGRPYTATTWFITGDLARRVRADLPGKSPTYELLWRMTSDEKRALWDAAMKGDGSKAQRVFWQKSRVDLEWAQALLASIGCRGKIADDPRGVIHWTDRPTVELQARHLAAADAVPYRGEVWCVTVPSGAFIVRRNGLVSVSGNSGFPKSLDVSKAIDRQRKDDPAWRVVGQWLKAHREAAGFSTRAAFAPLILDGHRNLESAAANLSNWENGLSCPTWERWLSLKALLSLPDDMDAEVWRLNGRKGTPGEAWGLRPVTGAHAAGLATGPSGVGGAGAGKDRRDIPATPEAERWQGWGTALKPAFEPVVVARKPLVGTVAANVLAHGTGALNIDACRIPGEVPSVPQPVYGVKADGVTNFGSGVGRNGQMSSAPGGRWPTNVVLDDSQAAELDQQSGEDTSRPQGRPSVGTVKPTDSTDFSGVNSGVGYTDSGGASRFFPTFRYEAKAPKSERPKVNGVAHPTVKPLDLMRWLVRLVTPPGGTVLEPFAGSGTTVEACIVEGFHCIAIEREADYLPLIMQRVNRRTDPVAYIKEAGDDLGLFSLDELPLDVP